MPEDTYEINMVFSDGVNAYDNNLGQDYTYPVEGGKQKQKCHAIAIHPRQLATAQ